MIDPNDTRPPIAKVQRHVVRAEHDGAHTRTSRSDGFNIAECLNSLDDGANLLCLERMDSAPIGSLEVAQKKARTAVIFKSPTKDFADSLTKGTTALLKLDVLPFEGGIPLIIDGKIVGSIGVSGGAAPQDGQVAQAGADWFKANVK